MKCDIIIPVWNQLEHTRTCIERVAAGTAMPYRLIVIDNGSEEPTRRYLEGLKIKGAEVAVVRNDTNLGFVKAVNQGMRISDSPYVCLLNNDTLPGVGWLERLIEFADGHPDIGIMNPLCDGHGDMAVDDYARKVALNSGRYMEVNQCFGFCMLIRRAVIDKIGILDEAFGIGGYDDTDYCMRAHKAHFRCACVHSSYVYHKQHVSFKAMGDRDALVSAGKKEYSRKWLRHLRIGLAFSMDERTPDMDVEHMLNSLLYLAREWCWMNVWIAGDKAAAKTRIDEISANIRMPLHQNIKLNFFSPHFRAAQSVIRVIERSFGTKRRKQYDAVLVDDVATQAVLSALYPLHKVPVRLVRFDHDARPELEAMAAELKAK